MPDRVRSLCRCCGARRTSSLARVCRDCKLSAPPQENTHLWAAQDRGACRGMGPDLFVGPDRRETTPQRLEREAAAKRVCASCPAVEACLEHALAHREYGVWAGTSDVERAELRRRHAAAA